MKAVIQRVSEAQVSVDQAVVGRIGPGLVVLLGVAKDDTAEDADRLSDRILAQGSPAAVARMRNGSHTARILARFLKERALTADPSPL